MRDLTVGLTRRQDAEVRRFLPLILAIVVVLGTPVRQIVRSQAESPAQAAPAAAMSDGQRDVTADSPRLVAAPSASGQVRAQGVVVADIFGQRPPDRAWAAALRAAQLHPGAVTSPRSFPLLI